MTNHASVSNPTSGAAPGWTGPTCVAAIATMIAWWTYAEFLGWSRLQFDEFARDRHAHLLLGMQLAQDLVRADLPQFLVDLNSAKVWPPLHGLLLTPVFALGGFEHERGVWPSLAAWVAGAPLIYLLARRLAPDRSDVAGWVAAGYYLASPGMRRFSVDIMLESVGATLSIAAILARVGCAQSARIAPARALALLLTLLLLHKSNYYVLVVAALLMHEWLRPRRVAAAARWLRAHRATLAREAVHPLSLALLAVLAAMAAVVLTGGGVFDLAGVRVSVRSHTNFVHVAFALLLARIALAYFRHRGAADAALTPRARAMLAWHAAPACVWFLLPKRLAYFLFYVSPANTPIDGGGLFETAGFYIERAIADYHPATWTAGVAGGLMLVFAARLRCMPAGAGMPIVLLTVSATLTVLHPHHQSRFLHTWLPIAWACAGAGLAGLLQAAPAVAGTSSGTRRVAVAGGVLALLAALVSSAVQPAALRAARSDSTRSTLDVTDAYLPLLDDARRPAIFATLPIEHQVLWTYLARDPTRLRPIVELDGFSADEAENERIFRAWLTSTSADALVLIDIRREARFHGGRYARLGQFRALLTDPDEFVRTLEAALPEFDARITVWRRAQAVSP